MKAADEVCAGLRNGIGGCGVKRTAFVDRELFSGDAAEDLGGRTDMNHRIDIAAVPERFQQPCRSEDVRVEGLDGL